MPKPAIMGAKSLPAGEPPVKLRVGFLLAAELGFVDSSHMSRCFKNEDSRRIFD
jgi:hypothetical protein